MKKEDMTQKSIIIMLKDELAKTQQKLQAQKTKYGHLEEDLARLQSWAKNMRASKERGAKREQWLKERNKELEQALEDRERELRTKNQELKAALQLLDEEKTKRALESERRVTLIENKLQVQKAKCVDLEAALAKSKRNNDLLKEYLKVSDREVEKVEIRLEQITQLGEMVTRASRELVAIREQDVLKLKRRNATLKMTMRVWEHRSQVALRLLGEETRKRAEVEADLGRRELLTDSRALSSTAFHGQVVRKEVKRANSSILDGHDSVEAEEKTA